MLEISDIIGPIIEPFSLHGLPEEFINLSLLKSQCRLGADNARKVVTAAVAKSNAQQACSN